MAIIEFCRICSIINNTAIIGISSNFLKPEEYYLNILKKFNSNYSHIKQVQCYIADIQGYTRFYMLGDTANILEDFRLDPKNVFCLDGNWKMTDKHITGDLLDDFVDLIKVIHKDMKIYSSDIKKRNV